MKKLKVHEGGRYLMWEDGTPFFYLGDTAWELFHRLTREEAEHYLSVRADQGFNMIQAVALAEFSGLTQPNAYGRVPLFKTDGAFDPAAPDVGNGYDYWEHVDFIVDKAAQMDLFIGLLPAWGCYFHRGWSEGPEIFTPENARAYGEWIAKRFRDRENVLWILGGDRPLLNQTHREIIAAMGGAIRQADPNHLITFHPPGTASSADFVAGQAYIDFHAVQSGHDVSCYDGWRLLRRTGGAEAKPFLDLEPRYEDHPACFKAEYGYLWDASDVRQSAWWALMEGVCGHTYGDHSVWRFNTQPQPYWPYTWQEALGHEAAGQMAHLAKLRMSRPYFEFRAAPELVADDPVQMAHQCAGRGEKYAFLYSPLGLPIRARLAPLGAKAIKASWFDPRTGEDTGPFAVAAPSEALFVPPSCGKGCDWVLMLDVLE